MLNRGGWLALLAACLLFTGTLAAATELEGFDEVEEQPPVVPAPVNPVRSAANELASLGHKWLALSAAMCIAVTAGCETQT